jgi:tetratricopeptide (TPR) repeat protein
MNIEAIFYKAEALRNLEEYEKSIAEYDRCMKFDPKENV